MASVIKSTRMTVEASDGVKYVFPNVDLIVNYNVSKPNFYGDDNIGYSYSAQCDLMEITGQAFRGKGSEEYIMMMTKEKEHNVATCKVPELYEDDLVKITEAMGILDTLSCTGVFACEIRVKTDDVDTWVVIGYGEDGAPAILRFEKDSEF